MRTIRPRFGGPELRRPGMLIYVGVRGSPHKARPLDLRRRLDRTGCFHRGMRRGQGHQFILAARVARISLSVACLVDRLWISSTRFGVSRSTPPFRRHPVRSGPVRSRPVRSRPDRGRRGKLGALRHRFLRVLRLVREHRVGRRRRPGIGGGLPHSGGRFRHGRIGRHSRGRRRRNRRCCRYSLGLSSEEAHPCNATVGDPPQRVETPTLWRSDSLADRPVPPSHRIVRIHGIRTGRNARPVNGCFT